MFEFVGFVDLEGAIEKKGAIYETLVGDHLTTHVVEIGRICRVRANVEFLFTLLLQNTL